MSQIATSQVVTNVADQLLAAIRRGELRPGQRISDAELALEFGVSRTPVREALVRLRGVGVVEASASRFTRIAIVGARQTAQALITWAALYAAIIDEVVPDADSALAEDLERHSDGYLFNNVLVARSENPELVRSITDAEHLIRLGVEHLDRIVGADALTDAQRRLIEAVRNRDVVAARESLGFLRSIAVPSD
jgi:DNA-binding GntR family transcriptional regulator